MTSDFDFIDWDLINGKIKPSNYDLTGIAERVLRLCAKEHPINKPIIRYVRYLNYIFRKYCIPVCATANFQIKFNEDVVYKLHNKKASEKKVAVIPFKIHATINFQFVKWGSHDESRHTDIRNGIMQESNFYSNASDWNIHAYGYSTSNAQGSNLYRYSIEKFFMHIDKAITIATTLSRKVNYEVTAYHFRSSEDS
jgi:hypothetical protein